MRFDLTDDQRAIREAVRGLCAGHCDSSAVRRYAAGEDDLAALWRELTRAGWPGIAVAEADGGQGLGVVELALVSEELGRALAPAWYLGTAAATLLLSAAGDSAQRERWLRSLAAGEARGALGMLRADGTALVLDAEDAAVLVLIGRGGAVIAARDHCTLEAVEGIDITRRLQRVTATEADPLRGDVACAVDRIEVVIAAELVGVAHRALDLAVEHARTRQQFGRPIGAYQAVSHRCADMLLDVESARSAVLFAAWTADHEPSNLPFAASVAKVAAAQGAWRVTASSLQVHGGIGFTWEHDCHLLLRRAAASGRLLGAVDWHLDRVAAQRGLGGEPPAPSGERRSEEQLAHAGS